MEDTGKIPLPKFLKLLTDNNVPVSVAISVAGKIYKDYNTPTQLRELTELKLTAAGVNEKNIRKLVISALRKAGYIPSLPSLKRKHENEGQGSVAGASSLPAVTQDVVPKKRKRRRKDTDGMLPDKPQDEATQYDSLQFGETLSEEALKTKSVIINRAPVMMAWATIVAERLGFQREEALSIAAVYTEMNAISKGISLGIYEKGKEQGLDANKEGSQPYLDLMGRRIPLFKMQTGQWRAISDATPAAPAQAFSYISRSLRQTMPHVVGAMRLLAESYPSDELNDKAWGLYAQFRPSAEGWGKRAEMKCMTILNLRSKQQARQSVLADRKQHEDNESQS